MGCGQRRVYSLPICIRKKGEVMKFEVEFCSTQQYLPSQRHKKLRCRCENHFFDVEVGGEWSKRNPSS